MGYSLKDVYGSFGFLLIGIGIGALGYKYLLDYNYWLIIIGFILLFSYYIK
jgi:hypothetical protein